MLAHTRRAAWSQALALLALAIAVAAALFWSSRRPFDRDTLVIRVGQLRSQAAEAALMAQLLREDQLAPGFAREHAQQLAGKLASLRSQLEWHAAPGALAEAKANALDVAGELDEALWEIAREGHLPLQRTLPFDALAGRMDALHASLKPGG